MYFLPFEWRKSITLDKTQLGGVMLLAVAVTMPPVTNPASIKSWQQVANPMQPLQREFAQDTAPKTEKVYQTQEFEGSIPVEYVETKDLPPGMSKVIREGREGLYRAVYQVKTSAALDDQTLDDQNLDNINPTLFYTYTLKEPEKMVVLRNSQPIIGEKFNLENLTVAREFVAEATAYTHTGYRTATGVYPRYGLIATDPRVIPLGTKLYVEGYGYAIAADTGGAIKGNRVDVFFDTKSRCLRWGRRNVKVYVLAN